MSVRAARADEIEEILGIYSAAREFMCKSGNPLQWGSSYPPRELVEADIAGGNLFVLEDEKIYGAFAFFPSGDSAYETIEGCWLNALPHAAIHRVASDGTHRGVLGECIRYCLNISTNLKIDTHKDNLTMQSALKKQGFLPCGIVRYSPSKELIAFQLCVDNSKKI